MKHKPNPELTDSENPEWTEADFRRARPASEVLPEILDKEVARQLLSHRSGQPDHPKNPVKKPTKRSDLLHPFS